MNDTDAHYASAQYEAEKDGWVEHTGGPCPVDPNSAVEIRTRGGDFSKWERASAVLWRWDAWVSEIAEDLPRAAQVVAYRPIVKERP